MLAVDGKFHSARRHVDRVDSKAGGCNDGEARSCCDWQARVHICVTCTVLMIDSLRLFRIGFMGIEF